MNKLLIPIDEIKLWDKNPREISDKDFQSLKKKIQRWDLWKPFLIWESKKQIIGGNMRYKACKELGYTELWVEYREPKDDAEALEMAIADNESSGEWIKSLLIEQIKLHEEEINLEDYKITIKDSSLKDIMPIDTEEDNPPAEEDINTVSVLGDLYELNEHRIMCGDSTSINNVDKLMNGKKVDMVFTDPPYGVSIGSKNKFLDEFGKAGRITTNIENDTKTPENLKPMLVSAFTNLRLVCKDNCTYFVTAPQGGELGMMMMMMKESGLPIRHVLMWYKNQPAFSLGRLDYDYQHEPIMLTWTKAHNFYGKGSQKTSVWKYDRTRQNNLHPTMKPIALIENALLNNSDYHQIVADMFLGSGSTLIACEKTERICYGMEIDPKYCDVIVARYIKFMTDNNKPFVLKRNGEVINPSIFTKNGS